ncbi:hypothetical protein D3C71_1492250 [compost metagenome]
MHGLAVVVCRHRHALDVAQVAVIALQHQRIHRRQAAAAFRVGGNALGNLCLHHGRHAKSVGERNGRFNLAQLAQLHQARTLAKAIDHRQPR